MAKGFVRGYSPLPFDTLPEMPKTRGIVPSIAEPVISAGTNPVGPTSALEKSPWGGRVKVRADYPAHFIPVVIAGTFNCQ
jgi:hypothetical protein